MRAVVALLTAAAAVQCAPGGFEQIPLLQTPSLSSEIVSEGWDNIITGAETFFGDVRHNAQDALTKAERKVKSIVEATWTSHSGRVYIKQNGITYEKITHKEFPDYQIRLKQSKLCDAGVTQYSGYLDIAEDKHLFFWFFESRTKPSKAPVVLWLNGGPGCSSSTGLLFELGPCRIEDEGRSTSVNKYSWNTHANMIFLDQPVDVGYSYSDNSPVNNTPVAAEDVWSFLEIFFDRFKEYSKLPFHIAAESYGGRYAPLIASEIHKQNQALRSEAIPTTTSLLPINLKSIIIGNGLTEPHTQMASVPEYACDGPYAVFDDPDGPQCQSLRGKVPTCQRLIKSCYDYGTRLTCVPAALYCWSQMYGSFQQLGLNPYDVRQTCNRQKNPLCYEEMGWIETFLNNATVKNELGADPNINFESCNTNGDGMHNSAEVLPELLESGVRLLVYAGDADFMCNYIGNLQWMEKLENPFHAEFVSTPAEKWVTLEGGKVAGEVKTAGAKNFGAGNYTYVRVYEAGHMVPFDQAPAALDLFVRWITDTPLTLSHDDIKGIKSPLGGW